MAAGPAKMEKGTLSILAQNATTRGTKTARDVTLRAAPHVDYLRGFSRVSWDPGLMGLEPVGEGTEPTLAVCPEGAAQWLFKIDCLKDIPWDRPLFQKTSGMMWSARAPLPVGLMLSPEFAHSGGFINSWMSDDKMHLLWGRVQSDSSASILCFVWLQHVLAGGKYWGRREINFWPQEIQEFLPLSYIAIGKRKEPVMMRSLGYPKPLVLQTNGGILNSSPWLGGAPSYETADLGEIDCLIVPELEPKMTEDRQMSMGSPGKSPAIRWKIMESGKKGFIALYSCYGAKSVDDHTEDWENWLRETVPTLPEEKRMQILPCLQEALRGLGGKSDHDRYRTLLALRANARRRLIYAQVSRPAMGGAFFEDKNLHPGNGSFLRFTDGLADRIKFSDRGNSVELEFSY